MIKRRVQDSQVVGTDETGVKVNGCKNLFWTWQTLFLTYIAHSNNRGSETIDREFREGFPQSTLLHDGWRAQIKTVSKYHQTCLSDLQRILNYLNQLYPKQEWGITFIKLLYDSQQLKKNLEFQNEQYSIERALIIQRFDFLLNNPPNQKQKELYTFYKRMLREKHHVFTFLLIENVPSDNNAAERAIRNVKVKQKISGHFKVEQAAQNFAIIRSVIDTTIKNGLNVLEALALISKFDRHYRLISYKYLKTKLESKILQKPYLFISIFLNS